MNPQEIIDIPIAEILITNPRVRNRNKWLEIVASIGAIGLKRPVTVSRRREPTADGKHFDLVCGQGRIEAFVELGETAIPAIVTEMSREEQFLSGLVENLARRPPSNCGIFREVKVLRARGHSAELIAEKLGIDRAFSYGLVNLIERGEESLVEYVEGGRLPIGVAVEIARGNDDALSVALSDAYQSGQLRGAKLRAVRRLVASRTIQSKPGAKVTSNESPVTTGSLVRVYEQTVEQQRVLVARAKLTSSRLLLLSSVFRQLSADQNFVALLQAEELSDMPEKLAERLR
jgi:ParB family transcriptional regulator, chromosome partitioning protein